MPKPATLHLSLAAAGRWIAALVAGLCLLAALGEGILRIPAVQSVLPDPNIAGSFEIGGKQQRLDRLSASAPPDCFFVGSSVVVQGLDPAAFADAYAQATGETLRCFNFGVSGALTAANAQLAEVLARRYHPRLIIYGVTFRDVNTSPGSDQPPPWMAYFLGSPSLVGWLENYSYLYRYYSTLRWYLKTGEHALANRLAFETGVRPDGFVVVTGVWPNVDRIPQPIIQNYAVDPGALAAIRGMAALRDSGVSVALVEMPIPPTSVHLLAGAEKDYATYLSSLDQTAGEAGLPFVHTLEFNLIPKTGWADPIHLNAEGARVLSQWLGQKLAGIVPN